MQIPRGSKRNLQLIYLRQKQVDSLWNLHDKLERKLAPLADFSNLAASLFVLDSKVEHSHQCESGYYAPFAQAAANSPGILLTQRYGICHRWSRAHPACMIFLLCFGDRWAHRSKDTRFT